MRVLFASSEIHPYAKIGGLGDVAEALPAELIRQGVDVRLLLPGYPDIIKNLDSVRVLKHPQNEHSNSMQLLEGILPNGLHSYVIDAPHLYDRAGPYTDENGQDWDDNHTRFSLLGYVAAELSAYDPEWVPDIVHGQDWLCGLMPAYLKAKSSVIKSVLTIHNMAYQGLFSRDIFDDLKLPAHFYATEGVEFYDKVGFLKAGLHFADAMTAVSPTYAAEIQQPELGCGLDGLLRRRHDDLTGILNGINTEIWNPETDTHIAATYNAQSLKRKKKNRKALLSEFGLKINRKQMVFGAIGRLVPQKGFDLLSKAMESLLEEGAGLVILGKGDKDIEASLQTLVKQWPKQVAFHAGYDEALAHRIIAGVDSLIVPSRFEPCGLVQMYAMRYGTMPVVHYTGGLADTVKEAEGSGFVFGQLDFCSLASALNRASTCYKQRLGWQEMQRIAMRKDFSWARAARQYIDLYDGLLQVPS